MERRVRITDLRVGDVIVNDTAYSGRVIEVRPFRDGDNGLVAAVSPVAAAAAHTTIRYAGRQLVAANTHAVRVLVAEEW